jgi:hypothetical protein
MPSGSARLLPSSGVNTDLGNSYMRPDLARFLKNLSYIMTDTSEADPSGKGGSGYFKPLERNQVYDPTFVLPGLPDDNFNVGSFHSKDENYVLTLEWNKNGDHGLYRINGAVETVEKVYVKSCLNLKLEPEHFLHEGGGWLEVFKFTDPNTGLPRRRSYFLFTDGINDLRFICIEDSIATNGFDSNLFSYFVNPHPECLLINAGVPTPIDCLKVTEVQNDDPQNTNNLRFKTWQFRVKAIDVYGRMSEHGIISDLYTPGQNDCIGSSDLLARCLDLNFDAGNPLIDKYQIEFRNCNDEQWYIDTTLFLYQGSNLGDWWLRPRNPAITFNNVDHTITYRFCRDKECNPIAPTETNRTENPLPRITQSVAKIGKVIGVGNNKHGFNQFGSDIMDQVSVTVTPPSPTTSSIRNIEIYVPVYNPFIQKQQFVWVLDNKGVFGGVTIPFVPPFVPIVHENYVTDLITAYKQNFGTDTQRGFIGYLAATGSPPVSAVSEQYYLDGSNNFVKVDSYDNFTFNVQAFNRTYFQKFTFGSIPAAEYIFRIAGHGSKLTDTNFNLTSTYVGGTYPWNNKQVNFGVASNDIKELIINVCDADYNSLNDTKVLTIIDPTNPGQTGTGRTQVAAGYAYAKEVNLVKEEPIELLKVVANKGSHISPVCVKSTDPNGFYFSADTVNGYQTSIYGSCGCNNYMVLSSFIVGNIHGLYEQDFIIDNDTTRCPDYSSKPCSRVEIKGLITLCDSNVAVPGVGVVLSRGGTAISGADGTFTIIAHPDNTNPAQTRVDDIYYVPTLCPFTSCDDTCLTPVQITILPCSVCTDQVIDTGEKKVKFEVKRGLLSGGKYGVGFWGNDWLGRHQFVQTKELMYIQIPTLVQTKTFAPSTVNLIIPPSVTFPSWVTEISIGITQELIMGGIYLDWIVDRVLFVDNSGNENKIAPTQIKIYYGSLIEYNKQNNFNTTTNWQFIVQSAPSQINFTSDYVEFYMNGDGNFFPTLTRALIKYDQAGKYFLIEYDTALKDLKEGALIRLCRPQQCVTQDLFFELCATIKIVNGKAQQNSITLDAFDTYYKYRQIPIPVPTADPNVDEDVLRTFGFPFEHHSPSDFWGDHCQNIGRPNLRNPYEAEIIRENQIMLSGVLSLNGQLNYMNYFDEALATDFNSWNFGGIVAILPQTGLLLCICEFDTFMVGFDDNLLRATEAGVQVGSADSLFGKPQRKVGDNFGCLLFDKNTIQVKEGLVEWLDTRECVLCQHDYDDVKQVSRDVVDSYIQAKVKFVSDWNIKNPDNKRYFKGTINPAAKEYLLTDFLIKGGEYINNEREIVISKNDTIVFDYFNKDKAGKPIWRGWYAFTGENYTYLEGQQSDLQLFSFRKGIPYKHYSQETNKIYSNFFGTDVELVIRPIAVTDGFLMKKLKNAQSYCKLQYWSDQILTDTNQKTRLLKSAWKQGNFFWSAGIKCDLNTPADPNLPVQTGANKITDGNTMYGIIADCRFVMTAGDAQKYSELTGFIIEFFNYEKSG